MSVSVSECTGKSIKWPRPLDHKPTVQHQSTSTAADGQASEVSKTTATTTATGRKDKDSKLGRKFGLSLFWRNGAKKEKPRKEYASFSGQFPPEEWPVRDEDDLNNLPRDLEHAIIKRINPELTVDNLTRHTVLMKKLEDRRDRGMDRVVDKGLDTSDKGVDKGMSTENLSYSRSKHHYSSKAGKRSTHKASRSRRRAHSCRDKSKEKVKNKAPICADDTIEREDLIPARLRVEIPIDEPDRLEECGATEEKCLYKKRIENPFLTHPAKEAEVSVPRAINRQHRGPEVKESGGLGRGKSTRTGYRSKSWDPHRAKSNMEDGEQVPKSPTSEDRSGSLHKRDLAVEDLHQDTTVPRELPPDYSSAYPQSSTLRMDDKVRQQRELMDQEAWEGQSKEGTFSVLDHQPAIREATVSLPHNPAEARHKPALHSLRHPNPPRDDVHFSDPRQLACEATVLQQQEALRPVTLGDKQMRRVNPKDQLDSLLSIGPDGFVEDDSQLYQRGEEQEEEEDGCSSLCLNEEDIIDLAKAAPAGLSKYPCQQASSKTSQALALCCSPSIPQPHLTSLLTSRDAAFKDLVSPAARRGAASTHRRRGDSRWSLGHHTQETGSPGPRGDSGFRPSVSIQGESQAEAKLHLDCANPSDIADESIFDYCQTSEMESDADTVRKSTDEGDSESAQWAAEAAEERADQFSGTCAPRSQRAPPGKPAGALRSEAVETENQSVTGDSGIDSPR